MDRKTIIFRADEQALVKLTGDDRFASNIVSYIDAHFDLGSNWDDFDAVRAVWSTNVKTISTLLDEEGKCVVPAEILRFPSRALVSLVGSVSVGGVLEERLTTYPCTAFFIDNDTKLVGEETPEATPSQFEQFAGYVREYRDDTLQYRSDAEAWAVGQRFGDDVASDDDTYENNSKYYADRSSAYCAQAEAKIDGFIPTVEAEVDAWMTAHPEYTTTVMDGSLTEPKFSDELKLYAIKDYVTPQMYGAKGDNATDDSGAFQAAINSGKIVYVPKGSYKIASTLVISKEPQDDAGKRRTSIIGAYNDTILHYTGTGNALENNGSLYLENIRIESLKQNTNGIFNSGTLRMYNCQSNGNGANGLMFDESVHVVHSIVEGCTFYANAENGIRCVTNTTWQKTSIRINNCYCAGNGSMTSASVAQNDLSGNGILLGACLGVSVIGTVCEYNHGAGILIRNDGIYAVMSVTVMACYFEGNRLANIYLYSDNHSLYHSRILIKSNYYSIYPATAPDYYTNSLLGQSIQTVISEYFADRITQSIVDEGYYDITRYKNGQEVSEKTLKCKTVIYTTATIQANDRVDIDYDTLKGLYLPNNEIIALNASIGQASDLVKGELYNDANSKKVRIRNTHTQDQYYLVTLQFFYEA